MKLRKHLGALFFLCLALPAAARWEPIGPSAVVSGNTRFSGPVRAVAVDPTDFQTVFAGTEFGGLWRTRDGGLTWAAVADGECSLSISAVAIDPGDPSIVYAGTGRSPYFVPGEDACGILRSTDGGETWTRLPASVFPYPLIPLGTVTAAVHDLLVDPRALGRPATTMLLAATTAGVFFSSDGGGSFTRVLATPDGRGQVWDLVRDPSNLDVIYAAGEARVPFGATRNVVFKSIDAGQTWQEAAQGLPLSGSGPMKLAIAPSSPKTLYVLIGGLYSKARLFRSENGASTWTEVVPVGTELVCSCVEGGAIAVSPTSPDQVYYGGDTFRVSIDGGRHWSTFPGAQTGYRTLVFDARARLYAGSSDGLFWSGNGGRKWQDVNAGLETTELISVTPHPDNPSLVYAGALGHGIVRTTGSREWHRLVEGPGGKVLFSPDGQDAYLSFHSAGFYRSDDGGQTFHRKSDGLSGGGYSDFPAPVAFGSGDPDRLLLGGQEVFRSEDRGDSWYSMGNRLAASEVYTALGTARGPQGEMIYAGTSRGRVWWTDSGGLAWVDRSAGLPGDKALTDLDVDPADGRTVYVTFAGFGAGGVFKTTDGGRTWSSRSLLQAMEVNQLLLLPTSPRTLVIATSLGVYVSHDDGESWTEDRSGLPASPVMDVAIASDGRLLAATFGRGVYVAPGLPEPAPPALRLGADDRFEVSVAWKTATDEGAGQPVRLTSDTGVFWFFDDRNLELVVKVLDGCAVTGKHWFFASGLTNVEVTITLRDQVTGETRTYHREAGPAFQPIQDTGALGSCPAPIPARRASAPAGSFCDGTALCLGEGGRFRAEATWTTPTGQSGVAQGVALTSDTGYFFFFDPANVEMLVKVVDGCGANDRHWVFAGGLTNVEVVLRVQDTLTQEMREYRNPMGHPFQPVQDTGAFGACQ